ncbi:unnamed protein product [Ilex paraguariensis]|uniref:Uncharacterized protein n=1 Tax=Ilex paraguariensis TaxID=185542 RepID=A0ABC8TV41_9AQUA
MRNLRLKVICTKSRYAISTEEILQSKPAYFKGTAFASRVHVFFWCGDRERLQGEERKSIIVPDYHYCQRRLWADTTIDLMSFVYSHRSQPPLQLCLHIFNISPLHCCCIHGPYYTSILTSPLLMPITPATATRTRLVTPTFRDTISAMAITTLN